MNVSEAVEYRRSVRAFLDQPVDVSTVRSIVERAARAASGGNVQPWHVDIVHGDALARLKAMIAEKQAAGQFDKPQYNVYPPGLTNPWEARRREVGEMMYGALDIPRDNKPARLAWFANNFRFFDAPVALFVSLDPQMGLPQWADAGALLNTIMLLLCEAGLDSCPQECWAMYCETLNTFLGHPEGRVLWTGMSIGVADKAHPVNAAWRTPRAPADEWLAVHG